MLRIHSIRKFRLTLWCSVQIWIHPSDSFPAHITIFGPLSRSILCRCKNAVIIFDFPCTIPAFQLLSAASNEFTKVGLNIFWELVQFEVRKTSLPHHLAGRPIGYGDELGHMERLAAECESTSSFITTGFREYVIGVEIFSRGWVEEFCPCRSGAGSFLQSCKDVQQLGYCPEQPTSTSLS